MNTESSSAASQDDRDPDERWLAVLAGRELVDHGDRSGNAAVAREASMMREALRRWPVAIDLAVGHGLDRPVDGAGASSDTRRRSDRSRSGWRSWRAARLAPLASLAAVATVVLVTFIAFTRPNVPAGEATMEPTVRSATDAVTLLTATDPDGLRGEIAAGLALEGVAVTRYRRFGRVGIDADLPSRPSTTLRALLDRHGIPMPVDGVLRVEIESRQP